MPQHIQMKGLNVSMYEIDRSIKMYMQKIAMQNMEFIV